MQKLKRTNSNLKPFQFDHSLKCVPIATKKQYTVKLFHFTNAFIQKIRWRAYFYEEALQKRPSEMNPNSSTVNDDDDNTPSRRLFPTSHSAPMCQRLLAFESDLIDLVKNIRFRYVNNNFQNSLRKDIQRINNSNNVIVFADKTNNLYEVKPKFYNDLLRDNITKDYRLCDNKTVDTINSEAWNIIKDNRIEGKIPKLGRSDAYITIKDHKDNFPSQIKCRLINPSKTHLGKISKAILDKIINDIRQKTNLTQWNNSNNVIQWFNNIQNKANKCFITFEIVEFYPSITKQHLIAALNFAKDLSDFSNEHVDIILHACKTILFNDERTWQKKDVVHNQDLFDVPMGSFHGAEICDLVGLFILNSLTTIISNCGMYRDDGLAIIDITSPQHYVRLNKKITKLMNELGFKITIQIGHLKTNFLDVSLDLYHNTYKPYRKPNSQLNYINSNSNHPRHIKKQLPIMIEKRLNSLSKNERTFNMIKPEYNEALAKSGFKYKLNFHNPNQINMSAPTINNNKKRKRTRKILFFNPPFCESVKTNIGREFLSLVDRHFPLSHRYHNLFNRKTLKISYSCMYNIKSIIQSHNRRILNNFHNNKIQTTHTPVQINNKRIVTTSSVDNSITTPKKQIQSSTATTANRYNLRQTPSRSARITTIANPVSNNNTPTSSKFISSSCNIAKNSNKTPLTSSIFIRKPSCNTANTNNNTPTIVPTNIAHTSSASMSIVNVNDNSGTAKTNSTTKKSCNCMKPATCPLDGNCVVDNVVYKVVASCNDVDMTYVGSTGTSFKQRLYNHNTSFRISNYRNSTELSKYMWSCFDRFGHRPDLRWSIIHNIGRTPTIATKICSLCNLERWEIALAADKHNLLNRRSEITGGCPHHRNLYFPNLPKL